MNGYRDQLDAISRLLTDILGDKVDVVTDSMADIQAGRTSILIDPPDLEWDRWADPETTWTITVLSGVSWKQPDALEKVFDIIGIGECGVNPTLAAIGNAVADATGVRFHEFPLTPGRVLAGLKAAGKA